MARTKIEISQPTAYTEAAIWCNEQHLGYDALTAEVTRIFHDVLGIVPGRSDIPDWGVAGRNFDRNRYL